MDKNQRMQNLVREAYERGLFNGTWLYAENGEIVSKGAVGWRDPADTLPMREDSLFDLASVSKNFTGAAIMLLNREGKLSLDDELTKFFPEVPYRGVTVWHLLHHMGGLPDYMEWVAKVAEEENTIPPNSVMIRFLVESGMEPDFAPGEKCEYSNTGYCVLAEIVEKASGIFFDEFMRKRIFEPAGMFSTRLIHRRKDHLTVENLAYGLVPVDGKYVLPDDTDGEAHCVVPLDGVSGDGIVHTNIFDLLAWDRALREEKLLTREEQELMYTPGKLNNGEIGKIEDWGNENGYGFGWEIATDPDLGRLVWHSGGWPGYETLLERYLDTDKVLIMLNCRECPDARGYKSLIAGMKAIMKGQEPKPIQTIEDMEIKDPDKSGWDAFCGQYETPVKDFPLEEVFRKDGDLYGKAKRENGEDFFFRLYPLGGNVFGRKGWTEQIAFGDGFLTIDGKTCKKR
ncbi:MAG: beta-lactamase family protein [Firmicutes bacterium]|nr:beta-lactamase family protein [Bacillota bacterium]